MSKNAKANQRTIRRSLSVNKRKERLARRKEQEGHLEHKTIETVPPHFLSMIENGTKETPVIYKGEAFIARTNDDYRFLLGERFRKKAVAISANELKKAIT